MLGIKPRYKKDIERASFQLTPQNIVGQFVALHIDLNENGLVINDYFDFVVGEMGNDLFKEKEFIKDGFELGKTALRFARGENPKVLVGFKEIKIAGFPKYKFITLDLAQVREYFDDNYGKKSISDIATHLKSIKNSLVQTSFFTIDMLPKSVVVKELSLPKQTTQSSAFSGDIPQYLVDKKDTFSNAPFYSNNKQESQLLISNGFWGYLAEFRGFESYNLYISVSANQGDYVPYIDVKMSFLLGNNKSLDYTPNGLNSVNSFWSYILNRYDETMRSNNFMPFPQSLGNGMNAFEGDNLFTGNHIKNTTNPIIGLFEGANESYLAYWDVEKNPFQGYNVSKSEMKKLIKVEKVKDKSKIQLKFGSQKELDEVTGTFEVNQKFNSTSKQSVGNTKDERFQNALSLLDSSKIQSLSNKNSQFKEVFDLAISEIYKTYMDSPQMPIKQNKDVFYFDAQTNQGFRIYMSYGSNIVVPTNLFDIYNGTGWGNSTKINDIQSELSTKKSEVISRFQGKLDSFRFYFDTDNRVYFDGEPPVKITDYFFRFNTRRDWGTGENYYVIELGKIEFRVNEPLDSDNNVKILPYFFDNMVEFSLKLVLTINVLGTLAMGKKDDMLEYFQRQVRFLIKHDLILTKEKLMEIQNEISKYGVEKVDMNLASNFVWRSGANLRPLDLSLKETFIEHLISRASENNDDLNDYFNPPVVINAEPIIEEPQIITTEPQVVEDDDFADIFAEAQEVEEKLKELQQQVAQQETEIDDLDL
jgi:hypothetical protein